MPRVDARPAPWGVLAPILWVVVDGDRLQERGIDLASLPLLPGMTGVGGDVEIRGTDGVIRLGGRAFCSQVRIAPAGSLDGIALLGRSDFFKTFHVEFEWYRTPPSFRLDLPPAA